MTMSATERRIVKTLLERAHGFGWSVSVNDGEAWTVKSAHAEFSILAPALATTDADTLRFRDATGAKIGSVVLVWGNDEDLISDCSDNEEINALCANI